MISERDCDAMDAHRERTKDLDCETRCRHNVTAPSGVLIGCARSIGHTGACRTASGFEASTGVEAFVRDFFGVEVQS